MRTVRLSHFVPVVLLFVVCTFASLSYADTVTTLVLGPTDTGGICTGSTAGASCGNYQFTISFDQTTSVLTFTVQPGPGATTAYLQGFGLTLFNGSITATQISGPSGFTTDPNSKFNNGNNNCGNATHPGSLCVTYTASSNAPVIPAGGLTFQFQISGSTGLLADWHIMANGSACASGARCGNVFALTNDGAPGTTPTPAVPEPNSLVLLGSGLLSASWFVKRRLGL